MKFCPLTEETFADEELSGEYKSAREIGNVRMGELRLFVKNKLKVYYIPYHHIHRLFRRVMQVPARMCCGKGNFEIEHLVICGDGDKELMQVQLPGTKAARILMDELEDRVPEAEFGSPSKA